MPWFRSINHDGLPMAYEIFNEKPPKRKGDLGSIEEEIDPTMPDFEGTLKEYIEARKTYLSQEIQYCIKEIRDLIRASYQTPKDWTNL
jgi:hypothetical protein